MNAQVDKAVFKQALVELGHDPASYEGKRLSFNGMCELYELDPDFVLNAIDLKEIPAHYDYFNDTIWMDALDAAHFYYCHLSKEQIFKS
ncbi:MAG: hypothetical protein EOP07_03720 [Proteobacteria bacterium]|nr:MAG: hypothetical protein EOP07_03720 [Pseudomonadota bacterium]